MRCFVPFLITMQLVAALMPATNISAQNHRLILAFEQQADSVTLVQLTGAITPLVNADDGKQNLQTRLAKLQTYGYLSASFDSLKVDSLVTRAQFYLGNRYVWQNLHVNSIPKAWLSAIGYKAKLYQNKPFSPKTLELLQKQLLQYAENNGYPFAALQLTNFEVEPTGGISAELLLNKGKFFTYDSLVLNGNVKINRNYLQNYLGIKQKQPYNESAVAQTANRLRELPFLQETAPPQVLFLDTKAQVNLYLARKKASRFNLVLGVLPRPPTTGSLGNTRQRFQVIGDGQLNLANVLGAGERLDIDFKSYVNARREFKAVFTYPYLPLVPLGADVRFELFIADTLFRDVRTYLGLQYLSKGNNYLKVFIDNKTSVLLSVDSVRLAQQKRLPDLLDVAFTLYGVELNREQLDYRFNPRKGYTLYLQAGAGLKRIKPNLAILAVGEALELNFENKYDSLNQNRFQYRIMAKAEKYWQLGALSVLKTALFAGYLGNPNLLQNELYRIGGNRLLRGFDEESIWASGYAVATLEYRFLLGQNANFFAFFDGAYLQNNTLAARSADYPFGFGLGANLQTKAGIFGLMYALGRQQGNPVNLQQGKIHFGYVALF